MVQGRCLPAECPLADETPLPSRRRSITAPTAFLSSPGGVSPICTPRPAAVQVPLRENWEKFTYNELMPEFADEDTASFTLEREQDRLMFGRRLRHLRRARGLTLAELGARVDRAPSALSMLENGRREPR